MAIEKWAKYKEDYHIRFQWTPTRVRDVAIWGIGFPFFLYTILRNEQVRPHTRPPSDDYVREFFVSQGGGHVVHTLSLTCARARVPSLR